MATPVDEIPLAHLPLDVLRRRIDAGPGAGAGPTPAATTPADGPELTALLAGAGLPTETAGGDSLELLRAELGRRLNDGRERARQRAALYRAHLSTGLLQFHARVSRGALERFILEAGELLREETGAPPVYLLVPRRLYRSRLPALYDVYGASIRGEPLVLAAPFGPLVVAETDLVAAITIV